ncbi:MAG: ABC transporter ATP-binding protein [Christensenella hongkongensis]|uniref:ABC transporter ATP-binding protein n=1 Tax=Christensenella hongkongensis TaxID=270498 RepID=UPI002A74DA62|nr:ABC transporter ATP-binding protein [Christensenella hongkongensis]MDY3004654.1 ABC transporter ATP-binding protein [Christensenella hongkongensis]
MRKMIQQFTFHHPKELIAPTVWLFVSEVSTLVPAILVFFGIYVFGAAFFPPYTLDTGSLIQLSVAALVFCALQYVIELISYWNTYFRAYRDTAKKRIAYIKKLRTLPLGFFTKKESGELINSFGNDFANVEYTMCYWLPFTIASSLLMVVFAVWMAIFDWRMAIAAFALLPVCLLMNHFAGKIKSRTSRRVLEARAKAATQLNEYLHGMKDLKAYRQAGQGFKQLQKAYDNLRKTTMKDELVAGSLGNLCSVLTQFVVPVIVVSGMYMLLGGGLHILDYIGLIIVATKLSSPMMMLVTSLGALRGMAPSGERLDSVMETPSQEGSQTVEKVDEYCFGDVGFSYGSEENVIRSANFDIPADRFTALVGPSGSGKSTLLRLMARFWDNQEGMLTANGRDIRQIQPDSLLSNISMVMQDTYLFRGTIRENLCFGKDIPDGQLEEACRKASCHTFISKLPEGYDTMVGEGGATLSGGERQRIALARALLKDVPILLLDEPTASLDADNEALVQNALDEIAKNRTVIMIAHRLKTVRGADQILVIENGSVTQHGTHDELLAQEGLYQRLWAIQNEAQSIQFKHMEEK